MLRVQTNLTTLDSRSARVVLEALSRHMGLPPLLKAGKGGGHELPDPRYPDLVALIASARADWGRWGERLLAALEVLRKEGRLPLSPIHESALQSLLAAHEADWLTRFVGRATSPGIGPGHVEVAFRLGRRVDALHTRPMPTGRSPSMDAVLRDAGSQPLAAPDRAALEYVQRRGEVYMRRPVVHATGEAVRVLNEASRALSEEEMAALRVPTARAVQGGWSARRLEDELKAAVVGNPSLLNDMERVARTELHFAHAHGAYRSLKEATQAAGMASPRVYRMASPGACTDCRRIWGSLGKPKVYTLAEVEASEATGGNYGRPRAEWGPTIGPTHPRCTCAPLALYEERMVESIHRAADEIVRSLQR